MVNCGVTLWCKWKQGHWTITLWCITKMPIALGSDREICDATHKWYPYRKITQSNVFFAFHTNFWLTCELWIYFQSICRSASYRWALGLLRGTCVLRIQICKTEDDEYAIHFKVKTFFPHFRPFFFFWIAWIPENWTISSIYIMLFLFEGGGISTQGY